VRIGRGSLICCCVSKPWDMVMNWRNIGPETPDEVLVGHVQRGQLDAYNLLVLRHQATAFNVAYRILGDTGSAADATQDAFLKAYQRAHQFRGNGSSFKGWLLRIVVNTCYDVLRSERRRSANSVSIDEEEDASEWHDALRDPAARPDELVLQKELEEQLQAAIGRLPVDQRAILVLSDVEGYQYHEIAEMLGVPIGTVKSRLSRARSRVRDIILREREEAPHREPSARPRPGVTGALAEVSQRWRN